jgi:hypothetical protein
MPSRIRGSRRRPWTATNAASARRAPAPSSSVSATAQPCSGAHDREDERGEAGGREHRPDDVHGTAPGRSGWHQAGRQREREERDGDVDVEDPGPAGPLGEDATHEHAGGTARRGGRAVNGEGLHQLLLIVAKEHHQQRQRRWRDERGTGALHGTGDDLDPGGVGQAGGEGASGEDRPAQAEQPLGAEQVAQPAAEEQQAAEGDHVGVEHPREVPGGEAEVGTDVGQRHADDGRVHDHHQLRTRDDGQGRPAPRIGCGLHLSSPWGRRPRYG